MSIINIEIFDATVTVEAKNGGDQKAYEAAANLISIVNFWKKNKDRIGLIDQLDALQLENKKLGKEYIDKVYELENLKARLRSLGRVDEDEI